MPGKSLSSPHKRQRLEQPPSQPSSKMQKLSVPISKYPTHPPPAFYDNLSEIWLTRDALRELDRRHAEAALSPHLPSPPTPQRPLTGRAAAELTKRGRSIESASEFLGHCGAKCLREIKQFAKHGGPDLLDLRGYPQPVEPLNPNMDPSQSPSTGQKRLAPTSKTPTSKTTATTRKSGPYNRNFQQNLVDGGVYPEEYEYPDGRLPLSPNNSEEIHRRLAERRSSFSPSRFPEAEFKKFRRANAHAFKEREVSSSVIPIIEGETRNRLCVAGGIPLTNLDPLTDDTIAPGNPDLFYGARPEQLDRRIRNELHSHIIPSREEHLPMAPNFFLAVKGPNGTDAVARRQACYDGALGARGIHSLRSYGRDEQVYDNNAYTITSIYSGGMLTMYTSHPVQPADPQDRPEYYMHHLNAWAMTGSPNTFRKGAAAYRNARDWTKEKRDEFIGAANSRVKTSPTESLSPTNPLSPAKPLSPAEPPSPESSTSTVVPAVEKEEPDALADELDLEGTDTPSAKRPRLEPSESNRRQRGRGRQSRRLGEARM